MASPEARKDSIPLRILNRWHWISIDLLRRIQNRSIRLQNAPLKPRVLSVVMGCTVIKVLWDSIMRIELSALLLKLNMVIRWVRSTSLVFMMGMEETTVQTISWITFIMSWSKTRFWLRILHKLLERLLQRQMNIWWKLIPAIPQIKSLLELGLVSSLFWWLMINAMLLMLVTLEQSWAQSEDRRFMHFPEIINQVIQQRSSESLMQVVMSTFQQSDRFLAKPHFKRLTRLSLLTLIYRSNQCIILIQRRYGLSSKEEKFVALTESSQEDLVFHGQLGTHMLNWRSLVGIQMSSKLYQKSNLSGSQTHMTSSLLAQMGSMTN